MEANTRGRPSALLWWLGALLAALVAVVATLRSLPTATVILVRHAEKQGGSDDPSLTAEGAARAERLAVMLGDGGSTPIGQIFSSEVRRTQETAGPLAHRLGLPVTVVPARDVAGLTARLLASSASASVVVGHSNTVPLLITQLTRGRAAPTIADDDFGSVFVVHVAAIGPSTVVRLRY